IRRLRDATGGWPPFVDLAVQDWMTHHRVDQSLAAVTTRLESTEGAASLVEATGISLDERVAAAWAQLVEYGEPVTRNELLDLLEGDDPPIVSFQLLRALQVLDVDGDGRFSCEPTLLDAWVRARLRVG